VGVSGQNPNQISYMTQQRNGKFVMIWWKQWELTHWNSLLTPCIEKLSGTLSIVSNVKLSTLYTPNIVGMAEGLTLQLEGKEGRLTL